ncbi:Arf17p [Stylosanthes scabra]|uniref:Arf17p n=1 Tax=Stylosanthes scabra TaxID=79078 RepID=A0ABU6X0S1_9FABA|nr:Arf17p [Stylosanthes scabra]
MGRETLLDSSRMTWFEGTVCGVSVPADDQPWSGSPWRMLQVKWNDYGTLMMFANFVRPWQVELLSDAPTLAPPTKKFRTTDGEELAFPIPDSAKGLSKEALLSYYAKTSHAGMQDGASHAHDVPATPPTHLTEPNCGTNKRSFQLFSRTIQSEKPADDESGATDDNSGAIDNK